ncbi:hypothetical protein OB905_08530 [Halobacteria archaeon AArc-dxtr1]|nr:hypothetical protein [Halobacteria archaeon AArc-dxtr1]
MHVATTYEVFTAFRVMASLAGVTFVIGTQHVAQWFEEENLGLAEWTTVFLPRQHK